MVHYCQMPNQPEKLGWFGWGNKRERCFAKCIKTNGWYFSGYSRVGLITLRWWKFSPMLIFPDFRRDSVWLAWRVRCWKGFWIWICPFIPLLYDLVHISSLTLPSVGLDPRKRAHPASGLLLCSGSVLGRVFGILSLLCQWQTLRWCLLCKRDLDLTEIAL